MSETSTIHALVGWDSGTWGYHSDDGYIRSGDRSPVSAPVYAAGRTIGVLWSCKERTLQFTLDGESVGKWPTAEDRNLEKPYSRTSATTSSLTHLRRGHSGSERATLPRCFVSALGAGDRSESESHFRWEWACLQIQVAVMSIPVGWT